MKTLFVFGLVGSSASSDSGQSCLYCLNIDTKVWSVLPFSPKHSKVRKQKFSFLRKKTGFLVKLL